MPFLPVVFGAMERSVQPLYGLVSVRGHRILSAPPLKTVTPVQLSH